MSKRENYTEDKYEQKRGKDRPEKRTKSQGRFGYLKMVDNGDDLDRDDYSNYNEYDRYQSQVD